MLNVTCINDYNSVQNDECNDEIGNTIQKTSIECVY